MKEDSIYEMIVRYQRRLVWLMFYQFQNQQHPRLSGSGYHCKCCHNLCPFISHSSCSPSSSYPSTLPSSSSSSRFNRKYSRTAKTKTIPVTSSYSNQNYTNDNVRSQNDQVDGQKSLISQIINNDDYNKTNQHHPYHHHHHHHHHHSSTNKRIRPPSPLSLTSFQWTIMLLIMLIFNSQIIDACGPGRGGSRRRSPRKLMPLVFKQHVPNVSENTLGASGLNEGPITRNHRRFKELVPNYNKDILFKDEEGTGADRLMTQRLKEKLNTLAISVMNQWPGVLLRVTEGWDEDGSHASNSLHYEGRAVDITTSDRDRSKYGMLARLAVEAGFDWVYYESRFHIHCSVKSEKSESARNGGCFDEQSMVHTRGGPLNISKLELYDEILTLNPMTGKYEYSPVIMFLDRDPKTERLYYEFETETGSKITLTPSHLLFVADDNSTNPAMVTTQPIANLIREEFAKNVYIGQYLYLSGGERSHAKLDRIVNIRTKLARGAYAPLTETGNLVINNITASCYAVIGSQKISHWSFFPTRLAYSFMKLGDRISEFLRVKRSSSVYHLEQSSPSGIHWYPRILYEIFRYFIPKDFIYN